MEVYAIGSAVKFAPVNDDLLGRIYEILIQPHGHVTYHVRWFDGSTPHNEWFEEFEVRLVEATEPLTIGFQRCLSSKTNIGQSHGSR